MQMSTLICLRLQTAKINVLSISVYIIIFSCLTCWNLYKPSQAEKINVTAAAQDHS